MLMQNNFSKCREWVPRGTSQHKWRWLTTLLLILTLGIGQMWGDDPKLTIANPDQIEYSQDGVYVTSPVVANAKMGNKTNQKCFYVTSSKTTASLNVFSKLTNIKSISFDMVRNTGSSSLGNAISLFVSKGDAYAIPTSTDFTAKRNNSDNVTSLQNVQAIGNNVTNQVTNISVTFTSNVKAIEFRNEYSSGTYVRNLVVTYESGTLPDTYLKATMLTSANDAINMDVEPTGVENASITANTDVSKKVEISEKNYCKMDGTFTINLGTGKTFAAGDQIVVDVCASAVKKQVGITIDSKTINTYLANTIYSQLAYVVKTGDGIIGKQTATFERSSSDTYIHSVSVLRAPAAATTYTLTLNPAGGSIASYDGWTLSDGKYTKSGITSGTSVALLALTKSGYRLNGWKDGDNADYTSPVTVTGNLTLTAQWAQEYAVSFAAGDHGTNTMDPAKYIAGETVELPDCGFVSDDANYVFDKWAISGVAGTTEGNPGDEFAMPAGAVTVTAQWREIVNRTITLDANGGTIASYDGWTKSGDVYSKTVTEGTEVSLLAFTKSGLQLMFFRDGDDNEYSSSVTLNADLNLKAIWGEEKEVELYYWEGKSGGATERGGEAVTVDKTGEPLGTNEDVNASNSTYYTLRVKGKPDYSAQYLKITTDKAVKTGDKITFTGYINKNEEKDAALLMKAGDKVLFAETTSLPNIAYPVASPESPEEREYTITTIGVDATVLDLMRNAGHTGTNCFVTRLAITGNRLVEKMEPAATPSITAQPTGASYSWKDAVSAMTVTATVAGGGTLHYQWYKKGETDTKVGTDAASYTPEVAGTYYVVVTNKKTGFEDASVTSSDAVVTITARPSYTVTYYDGTTSLGTESVLEEASPAEYAAKQAKAVYGITGLYEFEGWYNNSDLATEHKIPDIAALSITAATNVYGKWTRIEAEDVNLVEYAATIAGDASTEDEFNAFKTWFSGKGYVYTNLNALDNKSGNNGAYLGLKTKSDAAYVAFNVPANKRVTVKLGYMAQAAEMYINGTKDESQALTGGSTSSGNNYADWYYDVTEASTLKLKMTTGSTCVVKAITIGDIPTVNNDATLKSLKIAGTAVEGFAASTLNYYYELDYGFTSYPAVTYEKNDDNANVVYQDASDRSDDCSIVKVTAEDGVTVNQYIIHFYAAPKYGVELIKATHDGTASGANKAGYWASDVTIDKFTQNGGKLGSADHYFGFTLGNGKKFQAGDLVVVKASAISSTVELFDKKTFSTDQADSLTYLNKGNFDSHSKMYTFTLTDDADKLYLYRTKTANSQMNPTVDYIAVYRYMDPFIESFKIGEVAGTISGTNIAIELPYGTSLYGVAATIEAYANGGATVIAPTPLAYDTPLGYKVSSAYPEDGDVDYTVTITEAEHYEAKIGETGYATLVAAVEAAQDGDVIVLQEDVTNGAGVMLTKTDAKEITIDFGGYTYTAVSPAVGSAGTQNQAFHLEKGNTVTLKNGTITSSGSEIKMLIQNYCDLTLENITLDGSGLEGAHRYVMSNNCGNVEIGDGTTITAKDGDVAFDVCATNYYPEGVTVTVKEGATISGIVEYDVWGTKPADNHAELAIEGGNFDVTWNVEAALAEDAKDNLNVSGGTFTAAVPADYCAEGYAPTSWTVGTETKYGVHLAGVIRGAASTNSDGVYYYTLDNDVTIFSSESDGRLKASNHIATSGDIEPCGGDKGGYNVNQSKFVLKFPVNVKEFTLYGANSTERTISKVYVNAEASKDIKISNVGRELTGTYSNTKDGKCQTLTAVYAGENVIAANDYVLVTLSGTANIYRILYTEAECTDPVINSIDATRMKVGETATVSVDASAVGATYQWYRCEDALGANPQIIDGATAASYSFTKAAGDEYFKVVVGCNCSAATVEDVVKAEEWYEVIRTNVTGYTEWNWNGIADTDNGPTINDSQKGLVLASYIDAPDFDKLEGVNGARVYRSNQYPAYQGTQLKFTTEVPGMLIIDASYQDNGNTFSVNGYPMGTLPKNHAKDTIAVKAGDVTITSQGIRIWAMTFDPDFSNYALTDNKASGYTRPVTESRYGTICLPNGGVMTGAMLFDLAYFDPDQKKIFFDEVINGTMEAGTPYIFLPNEGVDALKVFYTDAADAVAGNANGLFGSYTQEIVTPNDGNYILLNNQYCFVNSTAYVGANRAYIKLYGDGHALTASSTSAPQPAPGRRRVSMGVQGEQVATGIEGLNVGDQPIKVVIDGQMYILRGDKMYDATGRLVK